MPGSFADHAPRLQWGALLASVVFHLVIFFAYAQMALPTSQRPLSPPANTQPRIYAELISWVPDQPEVLPSVLAPVNNEPQQDPVEFIEVDSTPVVSDEQVGEIVAIEASVEHPKSIDYRLPAGTSESSGSVRDTGPTSGAFGQVFDPRLRQRLQNNRMHTSTAKPDSLKETRDIHGNLQVDLGKGACLKAQESMKPGSVTNWYMTHCNSTGDDGDQMLRRVEQNWRKRGN